MTAASEDGKEGDQETFLRPNGWLEVSRDSSTLDVGSFLTISFLRYLELDSYSIEGKFVVSSFMYSEEKYREEGDARQ